MFLRKKYPAAAAALLPLVFLTSAPAAPDWWEEPNTRVIDEQGEENNYAPVNLGQLKHMAQMTARYFDYVLEPIGGAYSQKIYDMIAAFDRDPVTNRSLANLGQVKAVAKPFYDRLSGIGFPVADHLQRHGYPDDWPYPYPWNPDTPVEENFAASNIGQVKMIFSFDLDGLDVMAVDSDSDGLPDWWQIEHFGSLRYDAGDDVDGDGRSNLEEFLGGSDPNRLDNPAVELLVFNPDTF